MSAEAPSYDALIVGAGFSGIFLLYHLRKIGLKCRIYEAGTGLGGTWHWHTYPGADLISLSSLGALEGIPLTLVVP